MKQLLLFVAFVIATALAESPTCNKPYRLGHFTQLSNEDLRQDRTRAATQKQLKNWSKKQEQAQAACNSFVSQHPNVAVSKEFSFRVEGLAAVRERCGSFCGTETELDQLYEKEVKP